MPTITFFSDTLNERQPLLKPRVTGAGVRGRSDLEAAAPAGSQDPKRVWRFLWYLILNTFLIIGAIMTVTNDEEGAGSNYYAPPSDPSSHMFPQFDYKWALWRALGGGLSGAAGMSIRCIC
jgi:hypothetical protein